MPLRAVVLDQRTLERGSDAQRAEWETDIRELLANPVTSIEEVATLRIEAAEQQFTLRFETSDGKPLHTAVVRHDLLADIITDYIDVVRQITAADSLNQMEALDMAKKVIHDRAGRVLKRELREVAVDLDTARRLFTLLLALKMDTTRLRGLRGHRLR